MSNGVEVLVKDKNSDGKLEQRKLKYMHLTSPTHHHVSSQLPPKQSLLSSAVATVFNHQQISAMFPLHQLMQHNYIIKTCMTTYTYLTTVVQNKRSAISTFETIVSVVTTESLTNIYASDLADLKPTKTKYTEVKTIQPSEPSSMFASSFPKIEKRIDNQDGGGFDLIHPSEVDHAPCTTSCSCSHTKTEGLKTKYTNIEASASLKYGHKTSMYGGTKFDLRPTNIESLDKKTKYGPYEYDSNSHTAPTDKIVQKYTEVINDYSDEKDTSSVEESELLTNEQGPPAPPKNKLPNNKTPEKVKPEKPQKPNKNKFVVADLLKLGSLSIKGLSQLAPVIEKMTGGFIKRQDTINKTAATSTIKPAVKLTAYNVDKRVDTDLEIKPSNFPIYIPVDEMDTSESQFVFTNATLHQNLVWAAEHKQPKAHIVPPKIIHESPLVNGGIPISPGEIITANSDVIVGKPAVGGPLTLAASGFKLRNPVSPPPIDSFVAGNEQYFIKEKPLPNEQFPVSSKVDDSFDLRPPEAPKVKPRPNRIPNSRPSGPNSQSIYTNNKPHRHNPINIPNDHLMKTENIKNTHTILGNHGRPAFLDYIPSLDKPVSSGIKYHTDFFPPSDGKKEEVILDNNPSSSEIVNTRVKTEGDLSVNEYIDSNKPFLVDIQPSRVANILIPHGSSTALVFAGSSEPHKTGDYVDDPLPYPEPGYFGSFSIDAPQMTNVHNVAPNNNKQFVTKPSTVLSVDNYKPSSPSYQEPPFRNDLRSKWKDNKRPFDFKIPPPTSNQETHIQVGPQITAYDPAVYNLNNGDFQKYNQVRGENKHKNGKETIDKEYENYLAVPPPPPKMHFNPEMKYDKTKPHMQRPIIHTKPIQDMKVFLNIQHPVPNVPTPAPTHETLPPRVTSEIYFAAQAPNSKPTPTYTIHIPSASQPHTYGNNYPSNMGHLSKVQTSNKIQGHKSYPQFPFSNVTNKPVYANGISDKDNTYTVTLNTATNVANNIGDTGQVFGSSISVPVGIAANAGHANIPIGTNFAIRVEDNVSPHENLNSHNNDNLSVEYQQPTQPIVDVTEEDQESKPQTKHPDFVLASNFVKDNTISKDSAVSYTVQPSQNSHANFPMINDQKTSSAIHDNVKPVTEILNEGKVSSPQRPAKLIPNIPTNSHGWYSSGFINENALNNMNNIKIEATTRKVIPLSQDFNRDNIPDFGQKISSIGKPPSEFWSHTSEAKPEFVSFSIGKPFAKPQTDKPYTTPTRTTNPFNNGNYIPSMFSSVKQPAYDIPVRDNSDETTPTKSHKNVTEKIKPVYENSEEIYDGEEGPDNISELDGEISLESMKVPVVSSSSEIEINSKSSTEITLLQDEVFEPPKQMSTEKSVQLIEFNPGTQTEKPFKPFNSSNHFYSNTIKPIYDDSPYLKPRPFTINSATTLDHQLQQPHWQINQLLENATNVSNEENLELNIGEEMSTVSSSTKRPLSTPRIPPFRHTPPDTKYRRPPRPIFTRPKNVSLHNESNIITSTIHIQEKTPLIVDKIPEKSTLPPYTISSNLDFNRSSSEIIDLSPPPPTLDYNFKPSTNDEVIMGMSPPPPRTPPMIRPPPRAPVTPRPVLPAKTPQPYRTKPPRTYPPRLPATQRPIRKPATRDEISTYRPAFDINNIRRPTFNRDQPSSQLLPPPREIPSRVEISPIIEVPSSASSVPNIVFPVPTSSGWLTSSGIEFSSSFNFGPSSIQFPEVIEPSKVPEIIKTSSESSYSYETETSSEYGAISSEKTLVEEKVITTSNEQDSESTSKKTTSNSEENVSDSYNNESSQEEVTTDKIKTNPITSYKNRTRKPYPVRHDDKKVTTSKFKLPTAVTPIIKPTKTHYRPDIAYPSSRYSSTKRVTRPIPSRAPPNPVLDVVPTSVIESSETFIDDVIIRPTEIIKDSALPSISQVGITDFIDQSSSEMATPTLDELHVSVKPTHHAGNEIKISDDSFSTKTEFRTTVVTLTKTLSETPKTVPSINYVNVTHTSTVTHTMTSLVSKSEGAVTQTLILTNTRTSTIVDVVTEVQTQVQPTTIIETVTKHIPIPQVEPTSVKEIPTKTRVPLDDISMSYEDTDNLIIKDKDTTENIQKIDTEGDDNDTFFVVVNKSQNGGQAPPINAEIETGDFDGVTRNEQVNSNGVSQVLFGEILLAGTPYLETTNVVNTPGVTYGKECQPDCKASRNERCQRIDGIMKCVCRPGFARMFPDRPCKPTYTYSVKLALSSQGNERLKFHESLSDNSSKQYHALAMATHEGINRMVMQSDLRDVYHGVHITGFHPVQMKNDDGEAYQGVINDFYVQLSDNAHESRLKEVIEKYLRNNNYSLGGTDVHAAADLVDRLDVSDFNECFSGQFHDCSEHAQCYNLNGTYTCSCLEGFADLSVNKLYPGRICSSEPVGCERCNYHGACYSRDDRRVLCECFQWYSGSSCQINLKVVLISLVVAGALLSVVLAACAILACSRPRRQPRSIVTCIQSMPSLHQGALPSKQRADRRALISERGETGDASSMQNASLPYMPSKQRAPPIKKCVMSEPPSHEAPPPPPAVLIPRARLHPLHGDSRENISKKLSLELSSEAKLISYLESGAVINNEEMRRKHSMESSYSANKDRHIKQGALVSAGFKVSTTIRADELGKDDRDDTSSVHKDHLDGDLSRFDSLRKAYSQEDLSEWTDAERRIGELTLSEARSIGGTLPASTGRAASSTRLTHQEANTMAERDLGSTFLLPHVHLYKPDLTSDVSEFDSL